MYPTINLDWLIPGADISLYFLAIGVGFMLAAWITSRHYQRIGLDRSQTQDFFIWMLIIGVLGARLMHVIADGFLLDYVNLCIDPMQLDGKALRSLEPCIANAQCLIEQENGADIGAICNPEDGLCYAQQDCFRPFKFWAGGLTVYGALISSITFAYFYIKRRGWPFAQMIDIAAPSIFLGVAIGRLGCFFAGCCYGDLCDIDALAIQFPEHSQAYQHHYDMHHEALSQQWSAGVHKSLPIWPTQLISSAYNFVIFAVGYFIIKPRKSFNGQVILSCALMYGIARFMIEFVRADFRGSAFGLSTSQLVSLPILIIAACSMFMLWRKNKAKKED